MTSNPRKWHTDRIAGGDRYHRDSGRRRALAGVEQSQGDWSRQQIGNDSICDMSLTTTNIGGGGGRTTYQVQASIVRGKAISWFASNNVPYQVQWASDTNTWNNLGSVITGNGTSNTVFDAVGQPGHNFYQVLSIQLQ